MMHNNLHLHAENYFSLIATMAKEAPCKATSKLHLWRGIARVFQGFGFQGLKTIIVMFTNPLPGV